MSGPIDDEERLRLVRKLEEAARGLGFAMIRLETGTLQPEAIRLYETSGYARIPRFGEYSDDPLSVCFEKRLDRASCSANSPDVRRDKA